MRRTPEQEEDPVPDEDRRVSEVTHAPNYRGRRSSSERASRALAGTSGNGTKPETLLAKRLWARGLRYRKNVESLPGKPDLVFRKARVVVFVDGDFWHGRDWEARRARLERGSNAGYWTAKIAYNRERDAKVTEELRHQGWCVIRVWESEIKDSLDAVCSKIQRSLVKR